MTSSVKKSHGTRFGNTYTKALRKVDRILTSTSQVSDKGAYYYFFHFLLPCLLMAHVYSKPFPTGLIFQSLSPGHGSSFPEEKLKFTGGDIIPAQVFATRLHRYNMLSSKKPLLRGIVLNACFSSKTGRYCSRLGMTNCIFVNGPIANGSCELFAKSFYTMLASGALVVDAFAASTKLLETSANPESATKYELLEYPVMMKPLEREPMDYEGKSMQLPWNVVSFEHIETLKSQDFVAHRSYASFGTISCSLDL